MRILILAALVSASIAFGQGFSQLATNLDGSTLYFSSPLRLKGTTQYLYPKIFIWDQSNGVLLYEQRPAAALQAFMLMAPDVSSDGATIALTGMRFCYGTDNCYRTVEEYQSTFYTTGKPAMAIPGSATLSRNGRYALLRSSIPPLAASPTMTLVDLQTGQQTTYPNVVEPPGGKHEIANDGTVVIGTFSGFSLLQGGQIKAVSAPSSPASSIVVPPTVAYPNNPLINTDGSLVVYQAGGNGLGPALLGAYSVGSGTSVKLAAEAAGTPNFRPSISDDGRLVAFLYGSNTQAYVTGSDGTGLRQLTSFSEPVTEVELSGNGSVAYVATADNRIARIMVATGQSIDIIPPTPYIDSMPPITLSLASPYQASPVYPYFVSRGSTVSIPGSAIAAPSASAPPPYPLSVGGVELHAAGSVVPIAGVSPTSVTYPAPWGLPYGPLEVEVWVTGNSSPFVPGFEVQPAAPSYYDVQGQPTTVVAVHQDFLSLVSAASPARSGECLHVYAGNLGPVTPAPVAGYPAPLQPLSQLAAPIACTIGSDNGSGVIPVTLPFVGLAPGLLNVFQMDVLMPPSFPGNPVRLLCQVGDPSLGYQVGGFLPVQ